MLRMVVVVVVMMMMMMMIIMTTVDRCQKRQMGTGLPLVGTRRRLSRRGRLPVSGCVCPCHASNV